MRDTPPQPQCTPSPPLSAPCCRQVSARGFHGSLCCVWRHPLAEQASPSGVLRSLRYAQKKKVSLSFSLSLGNTPKCSRMSAPMPRGIPPFTTPLPSLFRYTQLPLYGGFNVFFNAPSNPRSLYYTYYFTTFTTSTTFYSYTNNTAARAPFGA